MVARRKGRVPPRRARLRKRKSDQAQVATRRGAPPRREFEAKKAPWRPALERICSKNERLSAQSFTRRYQMVRDTVADRAPRAFEEQALGSRRAERASEPRKGRPQRANEPNTKPGGVRVVCALRFFLCTKRIFKKSSGATRARLLCFIDGLWLWGWYWGW